MTQTELDELLSTNFIVKHIVDTHRLIRKVIRLNPQKAFKPYFVKTARGNKPLANVDLMAENFFRSAIEAKFGDSVRVEGEETLDSDIELEHESRTCVLIDIIDGTDLLRRGFSNWCSAIVVFNPQGGTIEGAFVALPSERMHCLYFATKNSKALKVPFSKGRKAQPTKLVGRAKDKRLREATVCLYAQKSSRLLKLLDLRQNRKFIAWLRENIKEDDKLKRTGGEIKFRFYNFAGNPMMVRIAEGDVDLVFDLEGQAPHDVVAGAFIALKAGAVIKKPNGEELSLDEIMKKLLKPGVSPITYVVAANPEMLEEMIDLLN